MSNRVNSSSSPSRCHTTSQTHRKKTNNRQWTVELGGSDRVPRPKATGSTEKPRQYSVTHSKPLPPPLFNPEKDWTKTLNNRELPQIQKILTSPFVVKSIKDKTPLKCIPTKFLQGIKQRVAAKKDKTPWRLSCGVCGSAVSRIFAADKRMNDVDIFLNVELDFNYTHLEDIDERNSVLDREIKEIFKIIRNAIQEGVNDLRKTAGLKSLSLKEIHEMYHIKYESKMKPIQWEDLSKADRNCYTLYSIGNDEMPLEFKTVININFKHDNRKDCWVSGLKNRSAFKKDSLLVWLDPYLGSESWSGVKVVSTACPMEEAIKELLSKKLSTEELDGDKLFAAVKAVTEKGYAFKHKEEERIISQDFANRFINDQLEEWLLKRFDSSTISKRPLHILSLINILHACDEILSLNPEQKEDLKQKLSKLLPLYMAKKVRPEVEALFFAWCRLTALLSNPSEKDSIPVSIQGETYFLHPPDDCLELWQELVQKGALFTFAGRISATREAPDVVAFDAGIASAISKEKDAADGCLAAGRKLTEKVNKVQKGSAELFAECQEAFSFLSEPLQENEIDSFLTHQMKELLLKRSGSELSKTMYRLISQDHPLSMAVAHLLFMEPQTQDALSKDPLREISLLKLIEYVASSEEPSNLNQFWELICKKQWLKSPEQLLSARLAVFKNFQLRKESKAVLYPLMTSILEPLKKKEQPSLPRAQRRAKRNQKRAVEPQAATPPREVRQEIWNLLIPFIQELSAQAQSFEELEQAFDYFLILSSLPFEKTGVKELLQSVIARACELPPKESFLFSLLEKAIEREAISAEDTTYFPLLKALFALDRGKGMKILVALQEKGLLSDTEETAQFVLGSLVHFLTETENQNQWVENTCKLRGFLSNTDRKRSFINAIIEKCKDEKNLSQMKKLFSSLLSIKSLITSERDWLSNQITPLFFKNNEVEIDDFIWLSECQFLKLKEKETRSIRYLQRWSEGDASTITPDLFDKISKIRPLVAKKEESKALYYFLKGGSKSKYTSLLKKTETLLRQGIEGKRLSLTEDVPPLISALISSYRAIGEASDCNALLCEAIEKSYLYASDPLLLKAYEDTILGLESKTNPEDKEKRSITYERLMHLQENHGDEEVNRFIYKEETSDLNNRLDELLQIDFLRDLLLKDKVPRSEEFMFCVLDRGILRRLPTDRSFLLSMLEMLYAKPCKNEKMLAQYTTRLVRDGLDGCNLDQLTTILRSFEKGIKNKIFHNHLNNEMQFYYTAVNFSLFQIKRSLGHLTALTESEQKLYEALLPFIPLFKSDEALPTIDRAMKKDVLSEFVRVLSILSNDEKFPNHKGTFEEALKLFQSIYEPNCTVITIPSFRSRALIANKFFSALIFARQSDRFLTEPFFSIACKTLKECLDDRMIEQLPYPDEFCNLVLHLYLVTWNRNQSIENKEFNQILSSLEKHVSKPLLFGHLRGTYMRMIDFGAAKTATHSLIKGLMERAIEKGILRQDKDKEYIDSVISQMKKVQDTSQQMVVVDFLEKWNQGS